jgi:3-hydroxyisobutyrate dehydrogenase-like beta-hydroxyacid dehydrogenase
VTGASVTAGRPVIAVLGLGEAGSAIASDLATADVLVRGFDPAIPAGPAIRPDPASAPAQRSYCR